ncbi:MAG: hypothetical protein SFU25_10270 [Candidatus Caenarcaniphilales bacterium]|nr:hypothetical protein [Candidatus Caenarcaniphilales bacterium]
MVSAQFATVNRSYIKNNAANANSVGAKNKDGVIIVNSVLDPLKVQLQISYVKSSQQFIADISNFIFSKTPRRRENPQPKVIEEAQNNIQQENISSPKNNETAEEENIGKTPRLFLGRKNAYRRFSKASNQVLRVPAVDEDETTKISLNLNPETNQNVEHLSYSPSINDERPVLRMPSGN